MYFFAAITNSELMVRGSVFAVACQLLSRQPITVLWNVRSSTDVRLPRPLEIVSIVNE